MKDPKKSIDAVMDTASEREVRRNRAVLTSIIETLKFAVTQNISLRGHRDDGRIDGSGTQPAENDGNFKGLLRFRLQSGDEVLKRHLQDGSGNALYTSKTVQNELLDVLRTLVQERVTNKVQKAQVWALMADDTTDISNREQMAVVARYVDENESGQLVIREDPVALLDVMDVIRRSANGPELKMSGKNLAEALLGSIRKLGLDTSRLVAQCYDGAAAMSSERVGVVAQVKEAAPLAEYFHCASHALNLSTSLINKVDLVRNALGTMETVVVFLTDGAKRGEILRYAQSSKMDGDKRLKLIKLCQTRFVERHLAVERFLEQLSAIHLALEQIATWQDRRSSSKATALLSAISRTEFLVGLVVVERLAGILRPLALALQDKQLDLTKALQLVDAVKSVLTEQRASSEKEFAVLMRTVECAAEKLSVEVRKPRLPEKSVYRGNAGRDLSTEAYYQITVFNPAVDLVLQDINLRFGKHTQLTASLSKLLPKKTVSTEWSDVEPAYEQFKGLLGSVTDSQVKAEFSVWKAMWRDKPKEEVPTTAISSLNACPAEIFPNVHMLLKVLSVLPVTTAEAERVFSKVARTLTALKTTMTEGRLEALVLLQVHRDHMPATSEVINRFAASACRRREFRLRL
ncbi:52 kDa repressor of the inhibitor of the protein kinase-like [Amphibalanus amphitrite]|nr:52 kDa repressor of the inhibitor of the protein kinase-like isoform X2 [Amphibalanus amphitrite]XP_043243646.1 52 kDa repressor of the inhibitor of the protein kinase-like [Amphibalanus amphitrite]